MFLFDSFYCSFISAVAVVSGFINGNSTLSHYNHDWNIHVLI